MGTMGPGDSSGSGYVATQDLQATSVAIDCLLWLTKNFHARDAYTNLSDLSRAQRYMQQFERLSPDALVCWVLVIKVAVSKCAATYFELWGI